MKIILLIVVGIITLFTISISNVLWTEYGMVCNNAVVDHLQKYSNVYVGETYNYYLLETIGLPFGVYPGNLQECVDFTFEQRTSTKLENMTLICQNAISDWIDVSHKLVPAPEDVLVREELFKQKNNATVTVLNLCDLESLTVNELHQISLMEIENEN